MLPKVEIKKKRSAEEYKISNHVFETIEKLKRKSLNSKEEINEIYEDAVGKEIAGVSSVIKYNNKELTVKVKDSVMRADLSFREEEIKKLINFKKNGYPLVKKIIFR
jgi:hypothetical protein